MDDLIDGGGAYKPLFVEFNGYKWHPPLAVDIDGFWHYPRALLPERLKQLAEADRDLRAHWDWLHPHERQRLVIQLDARRDPASPDAQDEDELDVVFGFEGEGRRLERQALVGQVGDYMRKNVASDGALIAQDRMIQRYEAEIHAIDLEQAAAEQQFRLAMLTGGAGVAAVPGADGRTEPSAMPTAEPRAYWRKVLFKKIEPFDKLIGLNGERPPKPRQILREMKALKDPRLPADSPGDVLSWIDDEGTRHDVAFNTFRLAVPRARAASGRAGSTNCAPN